MTNIAYPPRPVSLPEILYLYGQSLVDHPSISFGGFTFTRVLTRYPHPANLSTSLTDQNNFDYSESSNITAVAKTEVISDRYFLFSESRKAYLIVRGTATVNVSYALRADGVTTTYLDSSRITIYVRSSTGTMTTLGQEEYIFSTAPNTVANAYSDPVSAQFLLTLSSFLVPPSARIVLVIETFGHASGAGGTNNKIKLMFGRGTNQTHVLLPITEFVQHA